MQERTSSFGYWLRRRRKALDLTQDALAHRVHCSGFTIRKIEADERRPSRALAERLAVQLAIPADERAAFLDAARALHAVDHVPMATGPLAAPQAPAAADAVPLVGRAAEFALLAGLVDGLAAGHGQVVLIEGEPGIGKSRLMRELAQHARAHGIGVLASACSEIERSMPYQPVIELVGQVLDRTAPAALRSLAPVSLAELALLVPDITARCPDLPALSDDFPEARQARLARAVDQVVEASRGSAPLLLLVDDIHWVDDASLQVLHVIARHAARRAVLVVFGCRAEELAADARLARGIEALAHEPHVRRFPLARLGGADTARLVVALGGAALQVQGVAERLHRETDGNPFFLVSILQALRDGEIALGAPANEGAAMLPDTLRQAVRARLASLDAPQRRTVEVAAVFGRRVDFDMLLAAGGESEDELQDTVQALVRRRWLREDGDGVYDFCHDKLREVVYRDIDGARRRGLHRAAARALERHGHPDAPDRDALLAEHGERGQRWADALAHAARAALRSQGLFALRDALHWFDRAVALADAHPQAIDAAGRLRLHEQRGAARAQAGQTDGAVADFHRVIEAARAAGDAARARDALIQLGMAYRRGDAYEQASACLTEALVASRAMDDEHQAADTLYHLGTVAWSNGDNATAIRFHRQAVDVCERLGLADLVAVQAWHGRGEAHFANAEPAEAIACYERSIALARGIGDRSYECENLMMIGHAHTGAKGLGDYARARAHFDAALAIARAADLQWHLGPTLLGIDHVRACTGKYGAAWAGMQGTMAWLQGLRHVRYQLIGHDFLARLLLDLDLHDEAAATCDTGLALARQAGIDFWRAGLRASRTIAALRRGEPVDRTGLAALCDEARARADRYNLTRGLEALAEAALAQGDAPGCRAAADELLAIAQAGRMAELAATARRWRGEALFATGDTAGAASEWTSASVQAEAVGRVRLQLELAGALARCGGPADAAQALASAMMASLAGSGLPQRLA